MSSPETGVGSTKSHNSGQSSTPQRQWYPAYVAQRLDDAQSQGWRLRMRVQGPLIGCGGLLVLGAIACMVPCYYLYDANPDRLSEATWAFLEHLVFTGMSKGMLMLCLAVLPTDRRAVQSASVMLAAALLIVGSLSACQGYKYLTIDAAQLANAFGVLELCLALNGFALCVSMCCSLLRLQVRALLAQTWRVIGLFCLSFCLDHCCRIFLYLLEPKATGSEWWPYALETFIEAFIVGTLLLWNADLPQWIRQRLAVWRDMDIAAAGIASLLGSKSVSVILHQARSRCRSIPLQRVKKEDFLSNTPVQDGLDLNQYTEPACIGEVDAFISHSWHDDGEAKWEALQQWGRSFRLRNGREPSVWIDKYCIDQTSVAEDLMCLPVFLAGSSQLVILYGSTYLQRLWCILEVLVFLKMGGEKESISLCMANASSSATDLENLLSNFSVQNAQCANQGDKDRILAIVEAGFGGFSNFDALVKDTLLQVWKET
eukprot:TRINITY_DN105545_c0_g1_i1.p1 TRINITY_DN105545_c0_g1~~TRINITY_DN105545_c0_g1_i1.p1  ORF type:complete len:486 (-),score=73.80 TRINITY_DN105545_c0_g1_i1:227-1684(-)